MSGSAIAFSRIPANNLVPLFFVEFSNVNGGVNQSQQPTLLIGQMTSSGTATQNVPVFVPSLAMARTLFGSRSMLGRMCNVYFQQDNEGPLWCLPLGSSGTQATGTITVTGPATLPGALSLYVAGLYIPVTVNVGDTATVIAANIVSAIMATLDLPVTATSAAGVVTLTATNPGVVFNDIDIRLNYLGPQGGQVTPAGVGVTITAMNGGTVDPDMGGVAGIIGDQPFDFIGHPYCDATQLTEVTSLMNDATGRWAWNRQDFGHAFTMSQGTATSLLTLGGTMNDQHQTIIGVQGSPSPPWDWVADWVGAFAVSSKALASRPVQTLPLLSVLAPTPANWWNYSAQQALLSTGIAVPGFTSYGNPTIIRSVTTYQKNAYGVPDQSYLDAETMFTLMAIVRRLKAAITQNFPRSIGVPNGTPGGPAGVQVSPADVMSLIIAEYYEMEDDGLVTSAAAMIAGTAVQINAQNPSRFDVLWNPYLANGLRMFAVNTQFSLNPSAN